MNDEKIVSVSQLIINIYTSCSPFLLLFVVLSFYLAYVVTCISFSFVLSLLARFTFSYMSAV